MNIQTKLGIFERDGDSRWQSPSHQTTTEVDTAHGVKLRSREGIRSPNYFGAHVGKLLSDKQIDRYVANQTYEIRSQWLKSKREQKAQDFLPRLVYDTATQNFI